ncbi:hypothetical protein Tco_1357211 [Tanacetum coccineum]
MCHILTSQLENNIQESQPKVLRKKQAYMQLEDEEIQEKVTESGDVPQPYKSSSRHEISKPSKLSKRQHVSHPHKSVRENEIQESQPKVLPKRQAYTQLEDEEIQEEVQTEFGDHEDYSKDDHEENSTFDGKCKRSVDAIDSQLGTQHKNWQYRLHVIYKKYPTHEEALVDPPSGILNLRKMTSASRAYAILKSY